jgi:hypothetical protein
MSQRRTDLLQWKVLFLSLAVGIAEGCADNGRPPPVAGEAGVAPPFDVAAGDSQGDTTADAITSAPASVTEGPYSACRDYEVISPSTGCICSLPSAGSTVCLPTCKTDTDCPAPPPGGPSVRCMEASGGLFSYCVMLCQSDAGASVCPSGYSCSGYRTNIGPFCAVPGSDISDLSSRYDSMPFENRGPAMPIGAVGRLCAAPVVLSGELASGDLQLQRAVRVRSGCLPSPAIYRYFQDVHAVELVGPGPHRLELDSCGRAPYRMSVVLYQRSGAAAPYDTGNICRNLVASADPSARRDCAGGVSARFVGLQPGTVYVVVSSESPESTGTYQLTVKSDTSRCP